MLMSLDLTQRLKVANPTELDKATFELDSKKVETLLKEEQVVELSYNFFEEHVLSLGCYSFYKVIATFEVLLKDPRYKLQHDALHLLSDFDWFTREHNDIEQLKTILKIRPEFANFKDDKGNLPLHHAIRRFDVAVADCMDIDDVSKEEALEFVSMYITELMSKTDDIESRNNDGKSVLDLMPKGYRRYLKKQLTAINKAKI